MLKEEWTTGSWNQPRSGSWNWQVAMYIDISFVNFNSILHIFVYVFFYQISKYLLYISKAQTIFNHVLMLKKKSLLTFFPSMEKGVKVRNDFFFFGGRLCLVINGVNEWFLFLIERTKKRERRKFQIIYACISCGCDCLTT